MAGRRSVYNELARLFSGIKSTDWRISPAAIEGVILRSYPGACVRLHQFRQCAVLLSVLTAACSTGLARDWYVATNGLPTNSGTTSSRPIDLSTALAGTVVLPGDTVWLKGGMYFGSFYSYLTGSATQPITFRGSPGERATIADTRENAQNSTFHIYGAWTIYRDFEVTNVSTTRTTTLLADQFNRPMGVEDQGPNTKIINLVIHDTGQGIGTWKEALNSEIYGNIIYNNGWKGPDRGHGHGVYVQNDSGQKLIRDNIVFDQYGWGLHAYPNPGNTRNITFDGNVLFDNGVNDDPTRRYNEILVTGYSPWQASGIVISNNYTYNSATQIDDGGNSGAALCLGCDGSGQNNDITLTGNYFANGFPTGIIQGWSKITVANNTVVNNSGYFEIFPPTTVAPGAYQWDNNTYSGTPSSRAAFLVNSYNFPASIWPQTGLDTHSKFLIPKPTATSVFVRPNAYQPGRGHIIVYNWGKSASVKADLSKVLTPGTAYDIRAVENYYSAPVVSGTYDGNPVTVPVPSVAPTAALNGASLTGTGGQFRVFVVVPH